MLPREPKPFNRIEDVHYVDANTGAVLETVKMRRFYGWHTWDPYKRPSFEMIRQYPLDNEARVNPGFRPTI